MPASFEVLLLAMGAGFDMAVDIAVVWDATSEGEVKREAWDRERIAGQTALEAAICIWREYRYSYSYRPIAIRIYCGLGF